MGRTDGFVAAMIPTGGPRPSRRYADTPARLHACTPARLHACTPARLHACTPARDPAFPIDVLPHPAEFSQVGILTGMKSQFKTLRASSLYCQRCKVARPVRERLLLVLPDRELYDYLCTECGNSVGSREVRAAESNRPSLII